jgi:multidrug efflux system membrane fusion protein
MYPGDMANPGASIFQTMDLAVVTARAHVPENLVVDVRRGQACSFTPADNTGFHASGSITVINRAVDPQRRTMEVWCEIQNRTRTIAGNIFGQLFIVTARLQNATVVPISAVQFEEGTRSGSVLVVDTNMIAHVRPVRTAEPSGTIVPVLKGLQPGETIVVQGGYGLPDKAKVQKAPQEPAKPAEGQE